MKKGIFLILFCIAIQVINAQNNVVIYWDSSFSMSDRNFDRESNYLDNYFKKYANSDVLLVTFSNAIILEEKHRVKNGDWQTLKTELANTVYDGATSYSTLFNHEADAFLLFSDGSENLDALNPKVTKPIHIISTIKEPRSSIKRIADLSSGSYVVLNKDFDNLAYRHPKEVKTVENLNGFILGVVTHNGEFLANVNILNKNNNEGTTTAADGSYKIQADFGDVLVFTYLGKRTVNIRVSQVDYINVAMINIDQTLDAVLVEADVETEELVNTGNGNVDKKRLGYDVQTISSDDVSELDTDMSRAIKGKFANLEIPNDVYNKTDISQFLGRGKNMSVLLNQYGLIIVDGVPLAQSNSTGRSYSHNSVINPDLIHSVTYLKGLAATNKYGTLGRNGVILITTKAAAVSEPSKKKEVKLGTTDTYSEEAQTMSALPNTEYIEALKKSNSVDQAFQTYIEERKSNGHKADFFIDCYDYFKGWNNPYLSNRIVSNVYEMFFNDANALRALAFKQVESNKYEEALFTYNRILKLKPNQSQSYKDLAMAEALAKNYQEAFKMYNRIDKQRNVGSTDFNGINKTITNDFKNLINQHASKINSAGINPRYLKAVKYKKRIVFEWSNPDSQFNLQIVNPQKRFFTWPHTTKEAAQRIAEEKQQGYGIEEFYITSSDVGEWLFNVEYFGDEESKTPEYLKITTYTNFGYPNEVIEVKVVKLAEKNKLQTVAQLSI